MAALDAIFGLITGVGEGIEESKKRKLERAAKELQIELAEITKEGAPSVRAAREAETRYKIEQTRGLKGQNDLEDALRDLRVELMETGLGSAAAALDKVLKEQGVDFRYKEAEVAGKLAETAETVQRVEQTAEEFPITLDISQEELLGLQGERSEREATRESREAATIAVADLAPERERAEIRVLEVGADATVAGGVLDRERFNAHLAMDKHTRAMQSGQLSLDTKLGTGELAIRRLTLSGIEAHRQWERDKEKIDPDIRKAMSLLRVAKNEDYTHDERIVIIQTLENMGVLEGDSATLYSNSRGVGGTGDMSVLAGRWRNNAAGLYGIQFEVLTRLATDAGFSTDGRAKPEEIFVNGFLQPGYADAKKESLEEVVLRLSHIIPATYPTLTGPKGMMQGLGSLPMDQTLRTFGSLLLAWRAKDPDNQYVVDIFNDLDNDLTPFSLARYLKLENYETDRGIAAGATSAGGEAGEGDARFATTGGAALGAIVDADRAGAAPITSDTEVLRTEEDDLPPPPIDLPYDVDTLSTLVEDERGRAAVRTISEAFDTFRSGLRSGRGPRTFTDSYMAIFEEIGPNYGIDSFATATSEQRRVMGYLIAQGMGDSVKEGRADSHFANGMIRQEISRDLNEMARLRGGEKGNYKVGPETLDAIMFMYPHLAFTPTTLEKIVKDVYDRREDGAFGGGDEGESKKEIVARLAEDLAEGRPIPLTSATQGDTEHNAKVITNAIVNRFLLRAQFRNLQPNESIVKDLGDFANSRMTPEKAVKKLGIPAMVERIADVGRSNAFMGYKSMTAEEKETLHQTVLDAWITSGPGNRPPFLRLW